MPLREVIVPYTVRVCEIPGSCYSVVVKLTKELVIRSVKEPSSVWQTTLLVILTASTYLYRAHPYFLKPQLYAEDGTLWLSQGVYKGVSGLISKPYNGFFHFPERLFGYVVAQLPLQWAPALFAYTAWGLFILMAYYLLSSRTKILTRNFERILMALSLCLIANFNEFFFNFSNSIFLMGIIGALILVAKRPKHRLGDIAEKIFFVLTCFSLPFAWFYIPIILVDRFKYKAKNTFFMCVAIVGSIAQGLGYLTSHVTRSPVTLLSLASRWTVLEFYNQILIPAVRFARIDIPVLSYSTSRYSLLIVCLSVASFLLMTVMVIRKSNKQVWFLLFFLGGMTFASFKSPTLTVGSPVEAFKIMSVIVDGNRYFIYGIVAVNLIFVKAAYEILSSKTRYFFMGIFMAFGLLSSWHYEAFYVNKGWIDYTAAYRHGVSLFNSGKEKEVIIPVNPRPWSMGLFR